MLLFTIPATLNSLADKPRLKYLTIHPILPDPDQGPGLSPDLTIVLVRRRLQQQQPQQPAAEPGSGTFE
jgi:hypothetical protein